MLNKQYYYFASILILTVFTFAILSATTVSPVVVPTPVIKNMKKVKHHKAVFHIDKGIIEIPFDELNFDQQKSIEASKKILPVKELKIISTRICKTPLGLWVEYQIDADNSEEFDKYDVLIGNDTNPVIFYKHHRGIDIVTSHQGKLLLVNDSPAVLGSEVYVVELKTGKKHRIDKDVFNNYLHDKNLEVNGYSVREKNSGKNGEKSRLYPFFSAIAFSPDDGQALIKSEDDQWGEYGHIYKPFFYDIDVITGKVLGKYKIEPNSPWWK